MCLHGCLSYIYPRATQLCLKYYRSPRAVASTEGFVGPHTLALCPSSQSENSAHCSLKHVKLICPAARAPSFESSRVVSHSK